MGGWWRWALVSLDGVAPSRMVGVSASVNLPLHHKVQKFSSGTGWPRWPRKKGRWTVVVWCGCVVRCLGCDWTFNDDVIGQPFVKRFALCYRTIVLSCPDCPVLSVRLWRWCKVKRSSICIALYHDSSRPKGWTDQDETWHAGRPQPWPHCFRWGPSAPQKGHSPLQFSDHVHCGQTAGWIKMPLGMDVGLGPGDFVLDGDPAPPQKGGTATPNFRPMSMMPNGFMDQDATWYRGRPLPRWLVLDGDPAPRPPKKGAQPQFSAHVYCGQMGGWMPLGTEVGCRWHCVRWGPAPLPRKGHGSPIFGPCLLWRNGHPFQLLLSCCYKFTTEWLRWKNVENMVSVWWSCALEYCGVILTYSSPFFCAAISVVTPYEELITSQHSSAEAKASQTAKDFIECGAYFILEVMSHQWKEACVLLGGWDNSVTGSLLLLSQPPLDQSFCCSLELFLTSHSIY